MDSRKKTKEAQKEEDPFASIIKFCLPTPSQELKLQLCSFARENENFEDSISSSPDPTQTQLTPVVMVTQPENADTEDAEEEEDNAAFHTPPENHLPSNSSSEVNIVEIDDAFAGFEKPTVSEGGLDDEAQSKNVKVSEFQYESETEVIVGESMGNESSGDTEIIELDDLDSDETVNLDAECVEIVEIGLFPKNDGEETGGELVRGESMEHVEVIKGCKSWNSNGSLATSESEKEIVDLQHVTVNGCDEMRLKSVPDMFMGVIEGRIGGNKSNGNEYGEGSCEDRVSDESGSSSKIGEQLEKLKSIGTGRCVDTREESSVADSQEVIKVIDDGKASKNGTNAGVKSVNIIESNKSVKRRWNARMVCDNGGAEKRRQLPLSLKVKNNNVVEKTIETKNGILDLLDVLKEVIGGIACGSEDVDILETAQRQGMIFPRPRWWPPE